ncbi:unnamed protein product [Adineta ricciae]|uniref:Uncharacterized protein n=1 Tax=Adineta ricciae TaxID=249248 RepID=A0A814Z3Y0_ADIRI|nr:unnamed protein product [Adineta ricciae]
MVRVLSARFIQSLIFNRRKRDTTPTNNTTDNKIRNLLMIELEITYPSTCGGVTACNNHYITGIRRSIRSGPSEVAFRLSFTNGIKLDVRVAFASFNETIVTSTTTTTTETTSTNRATTTTVTTATTETTTTTATTATTETTTTTGQL